MSHELHGWELTEGRIGMAVTENPKVSENSPAAIERAESA